jgi:predicted nucleotidyltransferase
MTSFAFLRHVNPQSTTDEERIRRTETTCAAIVMILSPKLVYVFGSAAHGENFDAESDIDCLAVLEKPEDAARSWKHFGKIRKQLNWSLDLVCLSEDEFERKKDIGGVAFIATHEGKLVYKA